MLSHFDSVGGGKMAQLIYENFFGESYNQWGVNLFVEIFYLIKLPF